MEAAPNGFHKTNPMSMNQKPPNRLLHLLAACGLLAACSLSARANSYASSLTNNLGEVSFRLNDAADNVKVKGNAGTLTIDLGPLPRGLIVTNLASRGLLAGAFEVTVVKVGTGAPSLIGSSVAFNSPRGVTVNTRPASPYFGRVYVANSAATATSKGDGLFAYSADLADILNRGTNASTGGLNFATGTTSSPYRIKVGRDDDQVYVTDWSDGTGNLYVMDPDLNTAGYALKQLTGTAAAPVGAANNHGSVAAVETLGRVADGTLRIFTIDEDYQTDPTVSAQSEVNSLWEYDVGPGPLPWGNPPNLKLLTPTINFVSQTMDLSYSPATGLFYVSELRSSGNEAGVFIVDTNANLLFNSRLKSQELFNSVDVLANLQGVAASPDGKWMATVNNNNVVTIVPLGEDGLPDLTQRYQYTGFATTVSARGIAFDIANNLYVVSSGLGVLQSLSAGFTATNTTTSGGVFTQTTPSTTVSGILLDPDTTITNVLAEATASQFATFKILRANDDFSAPLSVNFTITGTATRGTASAGDYYIRTNGVVITNSTSLTIPTGADNILVDVVANDDNISELTETIIFAVSGGAYNAKVPLGATITIQDNDGAMVDISAVNFNSAFEGNTNDFVRYTLQRRGDTNLGAFTVNLGYAGTATKDVDYTSVADVTFDPGVLTKTVEIHPLDDALIEVNETVILSVATGTGYLVGTNGTLTAGATGTIIDDNQPTETVLFSDNFNTDTSPNYTILFGSNDPTTQNYIANFGYDYSGLGVPPAPHSPGGDTTGLMLSVNKNTDLGAAAGLAAGVDVYPKGQTFSGNYALRFDMYLMQNGSAATTEYAMFGINHDAAHTNWFNNSATIPAGWTFDGIFAQVEADGAALGDYVLNTAPATGSTPLALNSRLASTLTGTFHNPPWSAGSGSGAPGNIPATTTPSWAQVELSQIGNLVSLKINNTTIISATNNTTFKSGDIMLGYDDAYNSVGSGGGGLVIYDNVRVVRLASGINITSISQTGTNLTMNFTGFENEPASAFKLVTSTNVVGPYVDDATAGITYSVTDPAVPSYKVVAGSTAGVTNAPSAKFYMIRRVP
jgi:hypothetical protein